MANSKPVQPERRPLLIVRLWRSLPVILRAIIVGELVVSIGGVPPELAIVANLRTSPHLPWLLVVTAIWLWLFGGTWAVEDGRRALPKCGGAICGVVRYLAECGFGHLSPVRSGF